MSGLVNLHLTPVLNGQRNVMLKRRNGHCTLRFDGLVRTGSMGNFLSLL